MSGQNRSPNDPDSPAWPAGRERRRWPRQSANESANTEPPALRPLHFSTRGMEADSQFEAWRGFMAPLLDVSLPEAGPGAPGFVADHTAWNLGHMILVRQIAPAFRFSRLADKLRSSSIDHFCVSLPKSGRSWTEVSGRVAEGRPGCVEFRSLSQPFRGRSTESDSVLLYLPRDLFPAAVRMEARNNVVVSGNLAGLLLDYVASIEAKLGMLTASDLPLIVQTIRDMLTTALQVVEHGMIDVNGPDAAVMERARAYVVRNLGSVDLSPDAICRAIGVSRSRLYKLFSASGGVLHYIQKRRLLTAHAMLTDRQSDRRIQDIAEAVGFSSAANFSRSFKQEFGYSPREARDAVMPGLGAVASPSSDAQAEETFDSWLRTLGR